MLASGSVATGAGRRLSPKVRDRLRVATNVPHSWSGRTDASSVCPGRCTPIPPARRRLLVSVCSSQSARLSLLVSVTHLFHGPPVLATRGSAVALGGVTMTLHKLSAGSGYEYLTRQVAALDSTEKGATALADYYAAKGEAPGRWVGGGLMGIDGIAAGAVVTAEQMQHLFGTGADPVTGRPLGSPYRVYGNEGIDGFNVEVARRIDKLNAAAGRPAKSPTLPAEAARVRSEVAREWFLREHGREPASQRELSAALARYSRPRQTTVAGFDLTFCPVKSVSALWAVAPPEVAEADRAGARRRGRGRARVPGAARALHPRGHRRRPPGRDPRADRGRVHPPRLPRRRPGSAHPCRGREQGPDPARASGCRSTARSCTSTSSPPRRPTTPPSNTTCDDALGVRFADDPGAPRDKRPVREIVGVDPALCERWSTPARPTSRTAAASWPREFTAGARPSADAEEAIALAQQARTWRPAQAKHEPRSEAEQRATWRAEAAQRWAHSGRSSDMIDAALHPAAPGTHSRSPAGWLAAGSRARCSAELEAHRATWQSWHMYAEAQRQVRDVDVPAEQVGAGRRAPGRRRHAVADQPDARPRPGHRARGAAPLRRHQRLPAHRRRPLHQPARSCDAEQRIVDAAGRAGGAAWIRPTSRAGPAGGRARRHPAQPRPARAGPRHGHQSAAGAARARAGRHRQDHRDAGARAGSATDSGYDGRRAGAVGGRRRGARARRPGCRAETLAKLDHDPRRHGPARTRRPSARAPWWSSTRPAWPTPPRSTASSALAVGRGATVRLIGDDQQLAAVGAGGVLRDIASHPRRRTPRRGRPVRRPRRGRRLARPAGRATGPRSGSTSTTTASTSATPTPASTDVLAAWAAERAAGRDCLMLAPTRDLVARAQPRARAARLAGATPRRRGRARRRQPGLASATRSSPDATTAASASAAPTGSRTATAGPSPPSPRRQPDRPAPATPACQVTLPAEYVAAHVELGYATTVHAAQGITADVMHGILTGTEDRQLLYTMLTRGRDREPPPPRRSTTPERRRASSSCPGIDEQLTAAEILDRIVARDGASASATTTRGRAARPRRDCTSRSPGTPTRWASAHSGPRRRLGRRTRRCGSWAAALAARHPVWPGHTRDLGPVHRRPRPPCPQPVRPGPRTGQRH